MTKTQLRAMALEGLAEAERAHAETGRAVERWRSVLAELGPDSVDDTDRDFDEVNLIGVKEAVHRAGVDETTMRRWCRDKGIGKLRGDGQWDVSIPRLKRHRNTTIPVD
jgi:hypothetical protein